MFSTNEMNDNLPIFFSSSKFEENVCYFLFLITNNVRFPMQKK
jgi:hypothetical protein